MRIKTARELGMRLREAREDAALTQAELAERIGTSRQWVFDLERGKPTIRIGLVLRALSALGLVCDVSDPGAPEGHGHTPLGDVLDRARGETSG